MTEDEAKTKWCPMIRHAISDNASGGIAVNVCEDKHTRCIASGCAMWKWTDKRTKDGYGNDKAMEGQCGLIQT